MGTGECLPRIFLGGLERQGDALAIHVDVENLDGDFLANLDDLGRVVDVLPGQLGDVNQAVDTTEIDESAEVDDGGNDAGAHLALLQGVQEVRADLGLGLLEPCAAGQDHVVAVLVELDDLRFDLATDVGGEVADARQEATQADVEDQAALDDLDDGTGNDAVLFLDLLDLAPRALVLRTLLRQEEAAFLVFLLEDERLDLVAHGDNIVGVDVVLDGQLAREDDTLGLVADVKEDLVVVDLDDSALDDVAIVEVLDGLVDGCDQVCFRTNVVDSDLRRVGGHVVVSPKRTG